MESWGEMETKKCKDLLQYGRYESPFPSFLQVYLLFLFIVFIPLMDVL